MIGELGLVQPGRSARGTWDLRAPRGPRRIRRDRGRGSRRCRFRSRRDGSPANRDSARPSARRGTARTRGASPRPIRPDRRSILGTLPARRSSRRPSRPRSGARRAVRTRPTTGPSGCGHLRGAESTSARTGPPAVSIHRWCLPAGSRRPSREPHRHEPRLRWSLDARRHPFPLVRILAFGGERDTYVPLAPPRSVLGPPRGTGARPTRRSRARAAAGRAHPSETAARRARRGATRPAPPSHGARRSCCRRRRARAS